jgi:hypothetical protein
VPKVLAVSVDEDTAVVAHVLRVPTAKIRVEECVRDAPQRLHRRLESVSTDVELDTPLLRLSVHVHGFNLAPKLGAPGINLGKSLGALLGYLGEPLGAPLGNIRMCAFKSLSGRCYKPGHTGAEGGAQICL